jgi:hypothetical protein
MVADFYGFAGCLVVARDFGAKLFQHIFRSVESRLRTFLVHRWRVVTAHADGADRRAVASLIGKPPATATTPGSSARTGLPFLPNDHSPQSLVE